MHKCVGVYVFLRACVCMCLCGVGSGGGGEEYLSDSWVLAASVVKIFGLGFTQQCGSCSLSQVG